MIRLTSPTPGAVARCGVGATVAAVIGLSVACGDSTAPEGGARAPLQLSVAAVAARATSADLAGTAAGVAAEELVVKRVQVVLSQIELERAGGAQCRDDDEDDDHHGSRHDGDDCEDLELGPVLVDVPVTGTARPQLSVDLPKGSYKELDLKLRAARDTAFRRLHPEVADASVRVEGTYRGAPFVYTSNVATKLQLEFRPPLVVGDSTQNVTLALDVARWFVGRSGATIDPATAGPNGANRAIVESNIRASFRAFRDHDRDGREDD